MTDEQYEEWCSKLIIRGEQAFLPEEAHVADYERRKWRGVSSSEQRRRYQRNWRARRQAAQT